MDTITEAASSEAEEVSQAGDERGLDEAETAVAAQDASTALEGKTREGLQTNVESGEPRDVGTQAEGSKEDGEADHTATLPDDKDAVQDAAQTATHTPPGDESTGEDAARAADQTQTESCAAEGEAASETPQAHYNEAFVADDNDGKVVQV